MRWSARGTASLVVALALVVSAAAARPPPGDALPSSAPVTPPLPSAPGMSVAASAGAVIVVAIDGVRWQDVFGAVPLPSLEALSHARGAALGAPGHGAPVSASGPNFVSLPGYTEIFTGRAPDACGDNECPPTTSPTLVDELAAVAARPAEVAVFASWERIDRVACADPGRVVLSTGRHQTANAAVIDADPELRAMRERAAHADPAPGIDDFRPDRLTGALALRYLTLHHPRFLFVGLGEPDEYAHLGQRDAYLESLRAADRVVGQLMDAADALSASGGPETTLVVTADHGRADNFRDHGGGSPESGRVWLVMGGAGVSARGLVSAAHPHHLRDIAPTLRALLGLPADRTPGAGAPLTDLLAPTLPRRRSLPQALASRAD